MTCISPTNHRFSQLSRSMDRHRRSGGCCGTPILVLAGSLLTAALLASVLGGSVQRLQVLDAYPAKTQQDQQQQQQAGNAGGGAARTGSCASNCTQRFLGYEPSAWEAAWLAEKDALQANPQLVCERMKAAKPRTQAWLDVTTQPGFQARQRSGQAQLDGDVFSRFRYRDSCSGAEYWAYIEPMVGHFRWAEGTQAGFLPRVESSGSCAWLHIVLTSVGGDGRWWGPGTGWAAESGPRQTELHIGLHLPALEEVEGWLALPLRLAWPYIGLGTSCP